MFKLIQLLAAFVVRQYEKEALRLSKKVSKHDEAHTELELAFHNLAGESERELAEFLKEQAEKHSKRAAELAASRAELSAKDAAAQAASAKAITVKGALV